MPVIRRQQGHVVVPATDEQVKMVENVATNNARVRRGGIGECGKGTLDTRWAPGIRR
jgi:hypothetical protein